MAEPQPRTPLILESAERTEDGMGGFALEWRPMARLWGDIRPAGGREKAGQVGAESIASWRIVMRAARSGDARRPLPTQRLRCGSRVFHIDAVAETDGDARWLTCFAHEENQA